MRWLAGCSLLLLTCVGEGAVAGDPKTIADVIARVREQEAHFRNLDATLKVSWHFHPQRQQQEEGGLGTSVLDTIEATVHQVTRADRLFCSRDEAVSLTSGTKLRGRSVCAFDGMQTVAVDDGNSATIFRGRYEPAWVLPPHCWPLFTIGVNFPLSLYLEGTEAMRPYAKERRPVRGRGSVFEFDRVESTLIGEERVDDLSCIKVKVQCWHRDERSRLSESIQYFWLAKDRGYHVAQCRTAWLSKGQEIAGDGARVTKWRTPGDGLWLPGTVESKSFVRDAQGRETTTLRFVRRLSLGPVSIDPELPADRFTPPEIPDSLPRFVVGKDGRLEESPRHPQPAEADTGTTLASILGRLEREEARYDRFEVATVDRYQMLNQSDAGSAGASVSSEAHEQSIFAGKRLFFLEEHEARFADGRTSPWSARQAYDGAQLREVSRLTTAPDGTLQWSAAFALSGPDAMRLFRAHSAVTRYQKTWQLLASLKSGWFDRPSGQKMTVEYVGDSLVGGLHCHALKCTLAPGGGLNASHFVLWLARDRNLVPVRHEWHEPRWSETLPTGVNYVDDLREIRPGAWYPYRTTLLAFQKHGSEGLNENRPILQWRQDIAVESLTLDPTLDDSLFTRVEAPEGTKVSVRDEQGDHIGQFELPQEGNIDPTAEHLDAFRKEAKTKKEEAERRKKVVGGGGPK